MNGLPWSVGGTVVHVGVAWHYSLQEKERESIGMTMKGALPRNGIKVIVSGIERISAALGAEEISGRSSSLSVLGRSCNNALLYDILSPARFVALMYYCWGVGVSTTNVYICVYVWVGGW